MVLSDALGAIAGLLVAVAVLVWIVDAQHHVARLVLVMVATSAVLRLMEIWGMIGR